MGPDRHPERAAGERGARGCFWSPRIRGKFLRTVPVRSSSKRSVTMTEGSDVIRATDHPCGSKYRRIEFWRCLMTNDRKGSRVGRTEKHALPLMREAICMGG